MCGITGIFAHNQIGRMFMVRMGAANEALKHRGPEAGKLTNTDFMGMGHRRLAILDPTPDGLQPMWDEKERFVLAFNGEIYNFKTLRDELLQKGYTFQSQTDTEVLLKLLMEEGEAALPRLNGFFSFAFYDSEKDEMLLARDRFGIKPLVYFHDEDKFIFSSEIKSLLQYNIPLEIDYNSLAHYFRLHYVPAPHSMFKGVKKLLPGQLMRVSDDKFEVENWYSLPENQHFNGSYADAQTELLQRMDKAVQRRLISDVPLGAFLSGGLDSSSVVALAAKHTDKLNTFSIGFRDEPFYDETKYAEAVAKKYNTAHQTFKLSNDDLYEAVFKLVDFFGEPFADSSAVPFFVLSQRTRQKVTVALSGDGGDELFAGYNKYLGEFRAQNPGFQGKLLHSLQPLLAGLPKSRGSFIANKLRQIDRYVAASKLPPQARFWFLSSFLPEAKLAALLHENTLSKIQESELKSRESFYDQGITGEGIDGMLRTDVRLLLPNDMLQKADSMSMANSLEVRVPFLDHEVAEFAFSLPEKYKITAKQKKRIVQDAFRSLLPAELYNRPKKGFDVPLMKGFQKELRPWLEELTEESFVQEQGIFNAEYLKNLREKALRGGSYDQNHLWAILVFQHWWKNLPKTDAPL
jgi:asparagine synthase (glutamine-hydrolysing)